MENSKIAWTDHTFNPWWGCHKISPACKLCYADTFARRLGKSLWGPTADRPVASDAYWNQPIKWNAAAAKTGQRARVFCASMADVFEVRAELVEPRQRLARLIEATPHLDWLLLTKRTKVMANMARWEMGWTGAWPDNVWAGTTVENQETANERIPHLLQVPARVRFLSVEPLLEAVQLETIPANLPSSAKRDIWDYFNALAGHGSDPQTGPGEDVVYPRLSWVIVGGESGHGARPFDLAWARSLRDQCKDAGVPFFMKQAGANAVDAGQRFVTKDRAGADPAEWPEDLRVQEFPASR